MSQRIHNLLVFQSEGRSRRNQLSKHHDRKLDTQHTAKSGSLESIVSSLHHQNVQQIILSARTQAIRSGPALSSINFWYVTMTTVTPCPIQPHKSLDLQSIHQTRSSIASSLRRCPLVVHCTAKPTQRPASQILSTRCQQSTPMLH